jgi:serine protease Do
MKFKLFPVILTAAVTSLSTWYLAAKFTDRFPVIAAHQQLPVNYAGYSTASMASAPPPASFENAAEASIKAVVHIKTTTNARPVSAREIYGNSIWGDMLGGQQFYAPEQMGSGSGVVISPDGYIATNYHVVSNTDKVTVTFNDRYTAEAEVVAKDASTDLAVLKVKETNLPFMEFGNSDDVKLGQWVLAVGYPLSLDATVTAGIVSAKSRAIGINRSQSAAAIESFIQTDAAVNPGNSGGALVNTSGQLIGINSAIASPTGSYAGYSYAIPANIVKKVTTDLIKFGTVQRAYLGIEYLDSKRLKPEDLSKLSIDKTEGVYVAGTRENGGAYAAGIRKGDFITSINGVPIRTEPQLQEQIARYKPGDNISVTYLRSSKEYTATVQLKNLSGTTSVVKEATNTVAMFGAQLRSLTEQEKDKYGVNGGVVVSSVGSGKLAQQRMKNGFIITGVNEQEVTDVDALATALSGVDRAKLMGFYPNITGLYYYGLSGLNQ